MVNGDMSCNQVLAELGYTKTTNNNFRADISKDGVVVLEKATCKEVWQWLRETGQIDFPIG
jgi:hypothetical protein